MTEDSKTSPDANKPAKDPVQPLTFEECLQDIEQYRDDNCSGAAYKELLTKRSAQWNLLTGGKKSGGKFREFLADANLWNGVNGPDINAPDHPNESENGNKSASPMDKFVRDKDRNIWVAKAQDETPSEVEETEKTLSGRSLYQKIVTGMNFTVNIMPHPFRAAFIQWVVQETSREDGYLRKKLAEYAAMERRGENVHYDLFRAEMLEAFGQDMTGKDKAFTSRLFGSQYNNTYVTQLSNGTWQTLSEADVAQLLQAKDGPNIVVTANHAFGETLNDLVPITDAYAKLIKCSTYDDFAELLPKQGEKMIVEKQVKDKDGQDVIEKKELDIADQDRAKIAYERMIEAETKDGKQRGVSVTPYDKRPFTKGQTLLIAAVQTRENNFLNLAQLFHRLYDIDMANKNGTSATDTFEHGAPIARTMVHTLLKSIAQNPSQITLDDKTFPPRFDNISGPVVLRADACDIIRKALFFGFSKGGNDFRDGLRLLARTLSEKRDGQPVFQPAKGTIKDIINTVSVTAQSMNEKEMDPVYDELGVDTAYCINTNDKIAMPDKGMGYRKNDKLLVSNGRTANDGHHPDTILENLGQNPYILQLHRGVCAGLASKPAIRFVEYSKFDHVPQAAEYSDAPAFNERHPRHGLVITTEPGTSDELFEKAIRKIQSIFNRRESGLGHLRIARIPDATGNSRYEIFSVAEKIINNGDGTQRSDYGENSLLTRETMHLLADAFYKVNKELAGDIISSTSVAYPMLSALGSDIAKAQQAFKDGDKDRTDEHGNLLWKQKLLDWTSGHRVHAHNMRQFGELLQTGPEYTVGPDIAALGRVQDPQTMALASDK